MRFTYYFGENDIDFYWSNENGLHVLVGVGNPFLVKSTRKRISDTEKDILGLIERIPVECQNKVIEFIERNLKDYA